jgi:hypothetical protein
MGVIVTRHTTGSSSVSGSGAYTQLEKLANEMELEFKSVYLYYFKELTYNVQKQLTNIGIWTDNLKSMKLFNKDLAYNGLKQLIRTDLTRISDGETMTKLFIYNVQKQLFTITTSGSGPY